MLKLWKAALVTLVLLFWKGTAKAAPEKVRADVLADPEIKSFHVQSLVISRYAITTIICKIYNPSTVATEALFSVLLPADAFISNLTIEAGGLNYTSIVEEKERARKTYETAKIKGNNAAMVHQKERETSRFRVDVNVAAQEEVTFYLSYEELLIRALGKYTLKINVHSNYVVKDVMVDVTIHETREISTLEVVKVPGGENFISASSSWKEGNLTARVQFDPDPDSLSKDEPLNGQLVIEYDVKRELDSGDVQIEDGFFVHFFAPNDLQHTPKYITFLIDTSGSMSGTKIEQVKEALKRILKDLNEGDYFSITEFSDSARNLIVGAPAGQSLKKTFRIIDGLTADGGTNIDHGLKETLLHEAKDKEGVMSHIIILLTDGQPTSGVQSSEKILKNARERNTFGASIFCLGFGVNADMSLLKKLSFQNGGATKKIYEDTDAADQLQYFYATLSTPLLLDVRFAYSSDDINLEAVTKTNFQNYFLGTELVIAGQIQKEHKGGIRASITGHGRNGEVTMGVTEFNTVSPPDRHLLDHLHLIPTPRKFIKRLWAYMMVKELLNQDNAAVEKKDRNLARQRAIMLAMKFHFVTPLTSLVVVQPDLERCKDYEDDEDEEPDEDDDLATQTTPPDLQDPSAIDEDEELDVAGARISPKVYSDYELVGEDMSNRQYGKSIAAMGIPMSSAVRISQVSTALILWSILHSLCFILFKSHPLSPGIRQET